MGKFSEISEFYNSTRKYAGGYRYAYLKLYKIQKLTNKFLSSEISEFYNSTPKNKHTLNILGKFLRNFWTLQLYKKIRRGYEYETLKSPTLQFYNILKLFIKIFVWMYLKRTDFSFFDQIFIFSSYSKQSGKLLFGICIGASLYLWNLVDIL